MVSPDISVFTKNIIGKIMPEALSYRLYQNTSENTSHEDVIE